ncbi:MurR/RpiR family transcriptional regulator [Nonomuraea sp. NPDC050556]|uniref:MurR/RpiR family transcriptional regulator n=1 Tax=Nonomuraea sp. NPDC050556 TaxID=3364369 RepID=UPI0037A78560
MVKRAMAATPSARMLELFEGHRLTPTQRRIAQWLIENAVESPFLSSSELAARTSVSQPSVTRFAMALGYDGYPDLRRRLRELHLSDGGDPQEDQGEVRRNEFEHAVAAEITNLRGLADTLSDPAPIVDAGRVLAASRPLLVVGQRVAAPLARYIGFFAAKFHPDVRVLDEGGSVAADRLEQAAADGAGAVLAIVLPRYPRESIELLRHCRELELTVVTITDAQMSPAAAVSDVVLPAAVGTGLVFDSQAAPMVLSVVLLQAMCDAMPRRAQQRLEAFEVEADRRQLFVS